MCTYTKKIIQEIISTEKTYVHQLEIINKFFSIPLLDRQLLTTDVHSTVFSQLPTIYSTNKWLLEELQLCELNIGPVFVKFGPFLKAYSSYASNFQKSLSVLQEYVSNSDELRKFLSCAETRPEVQTTLSALLITPIQRIPRYKLLLEDFLKHTEKVEDKNINEALNMISSIADHLNDSLDDANMLQRLLVIQKAFYNEIPNIIVPGRRFVKEGYLNKVSKNGSSTQQRIFILFTDVLIYAKPNCRMVNKAFKARLPLTELKPNSLECCCILPLRHCQIKKLFGSSDHGITFTLQCQAEDVVLFSDNAEEGNSWIETISGSSKQAISKRNTLRKVSSNEKAEHRTPIIKKLKSNGVFSPENGSNVLSQLRSSADCVPSPKLWLQKLKRKSSSIKMKPDVKRTKPR